MGRPQLQGPDDRLTYFYVVLGNTNNFMETDLKIWEVGFMKG